MIVMTCEYKRWLISGDVRSLLNMSRSKSPECPYIISFIELFSLYELSISSSVGLSSFY
jgi:hypothetical protein